MKMGFIGGGNMASAMIGGIIGKGILKKEEIIVADPADHGLAGRFGILYTTDNIRAASLSDVLVLSVKPQMYEAVIREIRGAVRDTTVLITIAPGKTIAWIAEQFGKTLPHVRVMPNTPALVGEGMTAVCPNGAVSAEQLEMVCTLLGSFSRVEQVQEHLMDAVTSVSGSSPAYVFMLIEAMADAAVADGIPRAKAYTFAAQAVLGSAKMVLETGKHPGELKDMVCSPGGTTIEAVRVLERAGFRSAVMEAMKACTEKSRGM